MKSPFRHAFCGLSWLALAASASAHAETAPSVGTAPRTSAGAASTACIFVPSSHPIQKLGPGVTFKQGQATGCAAPSAIWVVTVDLTTPNLFLRTTTPAPNQPSTSPYVGAAFDLQLPSAVLASVPGGLAVVDANLTTNCCIYNMKQQQRLHGSTQTWMRGLQISAGRVNAPVLANAKTPGVSPARPFDASFLHTANGGATIKALDAQGGVTLPADVDVAVTGSNMLLAGLNVAPVCTPTSGCNGEFYGLNSRTAVGLSADGKTMLMVVADSTPPPLHSGAPGGLGLREFADVLHSLGAESAINLDGGGTSLMAINAGTGPVIVNAPRDGQPVGATMQAQQNLPNDPQKQVWVDCDAPVGVRGCERYTGSALVVGVGSLGLPPPK